MGDSFTTQDNWVWDNSDYDTAKSSTAFNDIRTWSYANESVTTLGGTYTSFQSKVGLGGDGIGTAADLTMNKFVGFHSHSIQGTSGHIYTAVLEHRHIQLDNDSNATTATGIWSDMAESQNKSSGNKFIDHSGGAPSSHVGDFYVKGDIQTDRVIIPNNPKYTPTNVTPDRTYDADSTTTAELADVLGSLIADLQDIGLIG